MNLVLLIGTNPLPVYITLEYFSKKYMKPDSKIYLFFSKNSKGVISTRDYANNIKKLFSERNPDIKVNFEMRELSDITSFSDLKKDISNRIESNSDYCLSISGGTKLMCIAANEVLIEKSENIIELYVQSKKYNIIEISNLKGKITKNETEHNIKLSLKEIVSLNNFVDNDFLTNNIIISKEKIFNFNDDKRNKIMNNSSESFKFVKFKTVEINNVFVKNNIICSFVEIDEKKFLSENKRKIMIILNLLRQMGGDEVLLYIDKKYKNIIDNLIINSEFEQNIKAF